ncbi:MAG: hypothetical protein V4631_11485 [Pseudomonadota bacterium]
MMEEFRLGFTGTSVRALGTGGDGVRHEYSTAHPKCIDTAMAMGQSAILPDEAIHSTNNESPA